MSLLGGDLAGVFSEALSGLYLDATLHRVTNTADGKGGGTTDRDDAGEPVKAQLDVATEAMRSADHYRETDVRILVLAHGVDAITSDHEITVNGQRWKIASVGRDPAGAYYDLHGRRA